MIATHSDPVDRLLRTLGLPTEGPMHDAVSKALAAERRATVERIREALHVVPNPHQDGSFPADAIYAILDEEAAR